MSPVYSPEAPALGCNERESNPVIVHKRSPKVLNISYTNANKYSDSLFKFPDQTLTESKKVAHLVTLCLINWSKWVDVSETWP